MECLPPPAGRFDFDGAVFAVVRPLFARAFVKAGRLLATLTSSNFPRTLRRQGPRRVRYFAAVALPSHSDILTSVPVLTLTEWTVDSVRRVGAISDTASGYILAFPHCFFFRAFYGVCVISSTFEKAFFHV